MKTNKNNGWIKCSEQLPEKDKRVLIYNGYEALAELCESKKVPGRLYWQTEDFNLNYGECEQLSFDEVTHWQPLPSLPSDVA
ncbi:DUF551 domain-containing protein [Testudinibacter sp. P80/BLE/0925]|uniref:DUF551 domain-containing protein n=1 Tax=Testudinibacter sp. TW-1 TaxID=3417757 RepID=UPI003D36F0F9